MKLASLRFQPLEIPFKTSFKHHSAERRKTQSVLVVAETTGGLVGVGEGCPREYVTGENVDTCAGFFAKHAETICEEISSLADLRQWEQTHSETIDEQPAAWCAMELAVLDAMAREVEQTVETFMGVPELNNLYHYTAVVGDGEAEAVDAQIKRYATLGFTDFKLKISGDLDRDEWKFQHLARAVPDARLRLDANNLWEHPNEAVVYLQHISVQPFAVEEPLQAMDFRGMESVARAADCRIVVDESILNPAQIPAIAKAADCYMINLRVSKMGGILRSLALVEEAIAAGLPMIVGAHVGETSLLARAALTVASIAGEHLVALEGAFGTHLLETDITPTSLIFGKAGRLEAGRALNPKAHGFQLAYHLPQQE